MKYFFLLYLFLFPGSISAQELKWEALNIPKALDRYNDVWFVDPLNGWAVIPGESANPARVYHTSDGGESWEVQLEMDQHFRAVTFLNKQRGFVSTLFGDEISPLYRTTNGGATWDTVDHFDGPIPSGICGLMAVDAQTVVGIGRVFGPAVFIRTTDAGLTWHSQTLPEKMKSGIDCYFWSPDSGIVVGGTAETPQNSHTVILATTDGGTSWTERFRGTDSPEWCWKISFRTPDRGVVGVEDFAGESTIIVTTDRGLTWQERSMHMDHFAFQGIGFITDSIGWAGGRTAAVMTSDAGASWSFTEELISPNRFRFFGDTLAYAAGQQIYRLKRATPAASVSLHSIDNALLSYDTERRILTCKKSMVGNLIVTDINGRRVMSCQASELQGGISLLELPKGLYICAFSENIQERVKLLIQ